MGDAAGSDERETFLRKVREKRRHIGSYVDRLGPRGTRLMWLSIVCGGLTTALTATSAFGGQSVVDVLGGAKGTVAWQWWSGIVAAVSLVGTLASNWHRSQDLASRLAKAQATAARLEGLETLVDLRQLTVGEAAKRYDECMPEVAFIPSGYGTPRHGGRRLDRVTGGIDAPGPGTAVKDRFACAGWVKGLDAGVSIWLAVEIEGRLWPKESPVSVEDDGSWTKNVFEEGAAGRFSLSLFATDERADRGIRSWLANGDRTGNYTELRRVPGMVRLDMIEITRGGA